MQSLEYGNQKTDFSEEISQQTGLEDVQGVAFKVNGDPEKLIVILTADREDFYMTISGARELALALRMEAGRLEKIGYDQQLIKGKQKPRRPNLSRGNERKSR